MKTYLPQINNCKVAILGLGYVGLPLAVEIAKERLSLADSNFLSRRVIGFDTNIKRLDELRSGKDTTFQISEDEIKEAKLLEFTNDPLYLVHADIFIVCVPTPIDNTNRPNIDPLKQATISIGKALKRRKSSTNSIVIYECTVYPGATEEVCVPILENESGLTFNDIEPGKGFFCGYSPERINPGDKKHKLVNITKITSGSSDHVARWVDQFYASFIKAGTYSTPNIKVAEAAKVIENTQRDINIALINELSIVFSRLGIDTLDVLKAAETKWNFLPFKPGLVGGHCIGVDPYYLTYKAEESGYIPQVVLSGRRINDGMSEWIVQNLILLLSKNGHSLPGAQVLILGLTFKEECSDLRNTKVVDIINKLHRYGIKVCVVDPYANAAEAYEMYSITVRKTLPKKEKFVAVLATVAHSIFVDMDKQNWEDLIAEKGIYYDLKGIIPRELDAIRP